MAYTKNVWVDQNVQRPKTYEVTNNADGSVTLTDSFGVVTEIGTPVNAVNMNHIEDGIAGNDTAITTINGKIPSNASSSNKMVTQADLALKANLTDLDTKADKTQLHALKSYKDAGELLTDADGLSFVRNYAHSTFDRSKFTIIGSPNITDDGIASGFSSSNYLSISNLGDITTKPFKIYFNYTRLANTSTGSGYVYGYLDSFFYVFDNNVGTQVSFYINNNGTQQNISFSTFSTGGISTGTNIRYCLEWDGIDTYKCTCFNSNKTETITNNNPPYTNTQIVGQTTRAFGIDLKEIRSVVDGVKVFSGNKTGVDTIKADDFNNSGILNTDYKISADGTYQAITTNDRLTVDIPNTTTGLRFQIAEKITQEAFNRFSSEPLLWLARYNKSGTSYTPDTFTIQYSDTYHSITLGAKANTTFSFINASKVMPRALKVGDELLFDVQFNTTEITCTFYLNTNEYSYTLTLTDGNGFIGLQGVLGFFNPSYPNYCAIDLNKIKAWLNGDLEMQACLKIPYTESKTGSKIVNSIYRDRVNDMAEQFGYANYYTLDEDNGNFTLPQVELYGYIEKRARDIAHPVAQPFYRFSDEINEDEVRLEGAEVDKDLYLAIEQDPYLSALCTAGSTADKICLPDFRNRVIYGDVASGYVEPELPNITGGAGYLTDSDESAAQGYGAFRTTLHGVTHGGNDDTGYTFNFDASRSSSIYKDGGTVKTAGVKARWLCRWK